MRCHVFRQRLCNAKFCSIPMREDCLGVPLGDDAGSSTIVFVPSENKHVRIKYSRILRQVLIVGSTSVGGRRNNMETIGNLEICENTNMHRVRCDTEACVGQGR